MPGEKDNEIPSYMLPHVGMGLEKIEPADLWDSGSPEHDAESVIVAKGYDQFDEGLLGLLIMSLIKAHPQKGDKKRTLPTDAARLNTALKAITGRNRKGHPADHGHDYAVLLAIATQFHRKSQTDPSPNLAEIIKDCLVRTGILEASEAASRVDGQENPKVQSYREKFQREKMVLLSRATGASNYDRMENVAALYAAVPHLRRAGIKLALAAVFPSHPNPMGPNVKK
jgi:hypothetical protein